MPSNQRCLRASHCQLNVECLEDRQVPSAMPTRGFDDREMEGLRHSPPMAHFHGLPELGRMEVHLIVVMPAMPNVAMVTDDDPPEAVGQREPSAPAGAKPTAPLVTAAVELIVEATAGPSAVTPADNRDQTSPPATAMEEVERLSEASTLLRRQLHAIEPAVAALSAAPTRTTLDLTPGIVANVFRDGMGTWCPGGFTRLGLGDGMGVGLETLSPPSDLINQMTDALPAPQLSGLLMDPVRVGAGVLERLAHAITSGVDEGGAGSVLWWVGMAAWLAGAGVLIAARRRKLLAAAGFLQTECHLEERP